MLLVNPLSQAVAAVARKAQEKAEQAAEGAKQETEASLKVCFVYSARQVRTIAHILRHWWWSGRRVGENSCDQRGADGEATRKPGACRADDPGASAVRTLRRLLRRVDSVYCHNRRSAKLYTTPRKSICCRSAAGKLVRTCLPCPYCLVFSASSSRFPLHSYTKVSACALCVLITSKTC